MKIEGGGSQKSHPTTVEEVGLISRETYCGQSGAMGQGAFGGGWYEDGKRVCGWWTSTVSTKMGEVWIDVGISEWEAVGEKSDGLSRRT